MCHMNCVYISGCLHWTIKLRPRSVSFKYTKWNSIVEWLLKLHQCFRVGIYFRLQRDETASFSIFKIVDKSQMIVKSVMCAHGETRLFCCDDFMFWREKRLRFGWYLKWRGTNSNKMWILLNKEIYGVCVCVLCGAQGNRPNCRRTQIGPLPSDVSVFRQKRLLKMILRKVNLLSIILPCNRL